MSNKFKVKKKLVAIVLALALAVQPLCAFPMNVFAGTGKNGVIKAPTLAANFDIDKIIELESGAKFDVNKYVTIISPQGATVSYNVESQTVFSGSGNLLDDAGQVQNPGIAKVKVTVGGVSKETYIIADINGILKAAYAAIAVLGPGSSAAYAALAAGEAANDDNTNAAANAAYAANAAAALAGCYVSANGCGVNYSYWAQDYGSKVDGVISAIVGDYKVKTSTKDKDWLGAAYAAVKAAKKMTDGKGLDLEAELKMAHMAYRILQFTWIYNTTDTTTDTTKKVKAGECKERADALQEVIDSLYSDKVGDIEAQG